MVLQQLNQTAEMVILRRVYEGLRFPNAVLAAEVAGGNWLADVEEAMTYLSIPRPSAWEALLSDFPQNQMEVLKQLTAEYTRLFVNDYGETPAPPYASVYLSDEPNRGPLVALQVTEWYLRAGMALPPDYPDPPDALGVELEYLIYLHQAILEAGTAEVAKELRMMRQNFCSKHMAKWVPRFARRVQNAEARPFYAATVQLLTALVNRNM